MTAVSCPQLPVSTPPKKRRHWSLGSFCSTLQFPLFPAGPALEEDLCLQSGDLSGMPVFPEPNLSSGYHTDDNQTAAERIKVIRPIRGSQTPLTLMLNWINSQGLLQGQRTWMYSIKTTWLILCRSLCFWNSSDPLSDGDRTSGGVCHQSDGPRGFSQFRL